MTTRWVVVDDTASGFSYSSGWSLVSGADWDKQGNFGPTYLNSLHSTTASEASFTYTYTGSRGRVYGTTNIRNKEDPTWECFVDGTKIPTGDPFQYTENNWVLCSWNNVADGRHTVRVVARSQGRNFLFDRFEYVPSSSTNIQNAVISASFSDSALQYSSGWGTLGNIARHAPAAGATLTIPFYGTGVKWVGYIPIELPKGPSTAEYSLDGGPVTTFTVPGSYGGVSQYNQYVLQVNGLSRGQHTLRVTSRGTTSQTPLVLCNLFFEGSASQPPSAAPPTSPPTNNPTTSVTNGRDTGVGSATTPGLSQQTITTVVDGAVTITQVDAAPSTSTTSTSDAGATSIGTSGDSSTGNGNAANGSSGSATSGDGTSGQTISSSSSSEVPIGPIVGGVVGALVLIALVIFAILFCRRRAKKRRHVSLIEQVQQPFYRDAPFPRGTPLTSVDYQSQSESSGGYDAQQISHTGNNYATYTKGGVGTSSPMQDNAYHHHHHHTNAVPAFRPNRRSTVASESGEGYTTTSGPGSEASMPSSNMSLSSTGSAAPLRPNRGYSKHQEARMESPQSSGSNVRIINHEDSGMRLPRASAVPTEVIEFPPSYSAS
ncbi:unnamed protein product [Cyclocybe aegerita]|uniref:Uncharacterized protein n=1 Tax=Cyclocybe aegerita TaxID=1973307 RepID=A0A8S0X2K5_CYCAE|nr:unnamed protein product [Cyclocybe aegerita]